MRIEKLRWAALALALLAGAGMILSVAVSSVSSAISAARAEASAPTIAQEARSVPRLNLFIHPTDVWRLNYPAGWRIENRGEDLTLFLSPDGRAFMAVDTYVTPDNQYGNMGENLRNRARDTLERIQGAAVTETNVLAAVAGRWQTGIAFTAAEGIRGEAVYSQSRARGRRRNFRIHGLIYGYNADDEATMRPLLQAVRASFRR